MKSILSILVLFVSLFSFASADDTSLSVQIDNTDFFEFTLSNRRWDKSKESVVVHGLVARSNSQRVKVLGSVIGRDGVSVTVSYDGYGRKFVRTLFIKNSEFDKMVEATQMATDPMKISTIAYDVRAVTFTDEKGVY